MNSKDIKKITPNENEISAIISDSKRRFSIFYNSRNEKEMSKYVFENLYDSIRELAECIALKNGLKIYSHEITIKYLFEQKKINDFDAKFFDDIRILRNRSKYYGENISYEKVLETVQDMKELFEKLLKMLE